MCWSQRMRLPDWSPPEYSKRLRSVFPLGTGLWASRHSWVFHDDGNITWGVVVATTDVHAADTWAGWCTAVAEVLAMPLPDLVKNPVSVVPVGQEESVLAECAADGYMRGGPHADCSETGNRSEVEKVLRLSVG
jgi:hypothetical protein